MDFEVYCDESGLEALTRNDAHKFTAIGGIWMHSEFRDAFKASMNAIKEKHNVKGELKWQKISPAYLELYQEVVNYFFDTPELRFRVIMIESRTVDNIRFNDKDAELGFYKFYYQLLHHWLFDFNSYNVFVDFKVNRNKGRLEVLKRVLDASNITSDIKQVQALHSNESLGIQMADILTGMVSAKFNKEISSKTKKSIIEIAETNLGKVIAPTPKWEEKFNVFKINLQGGW
ncbi:MAG: DUF3800 domain-containing protein [Bacteroidales bacterium]|jgi:hypothetical protein|nr:DUF3800 domain-containing protein [Bacteroidales bacterium]